MNIKHLIISIGIALLIFGGLALFLWALVKAPYLMYGIMLGVSFGLVVHLIYKEHDWED